MSLPFGACWNLDKLSLLAAGGAGEVADAGASADCACVVGDETDETVRIYFMQSTDWF